MGIEIERKFQVLGQAWRAAAERVQPMVQGYLDGTATTARTHGPGQGKASVRVRIEGDRAFLNLKSRQSGPMRQEFEYPIPLVDARALLQLCSGSLVEENRHSLHHQGNLWEVDEFLGDNAGLVVAEIELDAVDEVFARPAWLGAEVTDQTRYYNLALASHPYAQWPPDQRHDPA